MPIIREYEQQLSAPRRAVGPVANPNAPLQVGAGMRELGGAISKVGAQITDLVEQNDLVKLQEEGAQLRAEFAAKLQKAKETGEASDPEYVKYAYEQAQEAAGKLAEGKQSRRGIEAARVFGAQFAASIQTQAIGDNAYAIGEQAKQTALSTQSINRNTLRSSPEQFTAILGETLAHLDGPAYSNVDASLRERIKQEAKQGLAISAIEGVIHTRSPEEAKQILDTGAFDGFLSGDAKGALYREADQAIRAREAEALRLEAQQRRLDEQAREEVKDEFVGLMNSPNGNQLSVKKILASPLLAAEKEHFINMMKAAAQNRHADDPGVVNNLFRRIHLPDNDPNKITSDTELYQYFGRGLGFTGLSHLRGELKADPLGKAYSDSADTAYRMFRGSKVGAALPDVAEAAALQWRLEAKEAIEKYREEGKNPRDLFTPGAKDYLLSPEKLSTYIKPANIVTADQAAAVEGSMQNPAKVATKADYDALPSGAHYVDPDGKHKVKR